MELLPINLMMVILLGKNGQQSMKRTNVLVYLRWSLCLCLGLPRGSPKSSHIQDTYLSSLEQRN